MTQNGTLTNAYSEFTEKLETLTFEMEDAPEEYENPSDVYYEEARELIERFSNKELVVIYTEFVVMTLEDEMSIADMKHEIERHIVHKLKEEVE